jgi:hypothetical protein
MIWPSATRVFESYKHILEKRFITNLLYLLLWLLYVVGTRNMVICRSRVFKSYKHILGEKIHKPI